MSVLGKKWMKIFRNSEITTRIRIMKLGCLLKNIVAILGVRNDSKCWDKIGKLSRIVKALHAHVHLEMFFKLM